MPLAQRFLERYSTDMGKGELRFSVECANLLINYAWPGNVRELENSMEHAVVLAEDAVIRPQHLPPEIYQALSTPIQKNFGRLSEMEKETIANALRQTGGNRAKAAAILGIGTSTLYRKLRKYHIKMAFRHGDSDLQG